MNNVIYAIPMDNVGSKLWIKNLHTDKGATLIEYKDSTMESFMTAPILVEKGVCSLEDIKTGTSLHKFEDTWLNKLDPNYVTTI